VRIRRHTYKPALITSSAQSSTAACSCGWRGTVVSEPDATPDPGFNDWMSSHMEPFMGEGGLRGIVAYDNISRLTAAFASADHVHWNSSDRRIVALSWGWWSTINRTARGILMLCSNGQSREAVPLVRAVFEHSLFLVALIRHGESAVDAAVREHMRHTRNVMETGKGGPALAIMKVKPGKVDVPDPTPDAEWTQQVVTICSQLGLTNTLYFFYRLLCKYSHPTIGAAQQFLEAPDELDLGLTKEPDFDLDSDMLFWTAVLMIWAGRAFNTLLVQPVLNDELQLAERELGVVPIDQLPTSSHFGAMDVSQIRLEQIWDAYFAS
jgi:Family of unknown function (DUF5677)